MNVLHYCSITIEIFDSIQFSVELKGINSFIYLDRGFSMTPVDLNKMLSRFQDSLMRPRHSVSFKPDD